MLFSLMKGLIFMSKQIKIYKNSEKNCISCGNGGSWQGKSLIYQLSHADGRIKNMGIKNIYLLCPNCHSQKS